VFRSVGYVQSRALHCNRPIGVQKKFNMEIDILNRSRVTNTNWWLIEPPSPFLLDVLRHWHGRRAVKTNVHGELIIG